MANVDLQFIKDYIRGHDDEDVLIQVLIDAAVAYLHGAGIDPGTTDDAAFILAVAKLVADDYEHRNTFDDQQDWGPAMRRRVTQLKLDAGIQRAVTAE